MPRTAAIRFNFGPGNGNSTGDFLLKSANLDVNKKIDALIFADSRGSCLEDMDVGWAPLLFDFLKKENLSVLLVVRPKDCTVFLTLMNFLRLNKLKFNYLIAQVGLVDFTPKKSEVIDDILGQREVFFNNMKFRLDKLGKYSLSSGKEEHLYSIEFNKVIFKNAIVECLKRHCKYAAFVGTLEVDSKIKIKRKRPLEFYARLKESNKFLIDLQKISKKIGYIQPFGKSFYKPNDFSYDGVHYTKSGHKLIYNSVRGIVLKSGKIFRQGEGD